MSQLPDKFNANPPKGWKHIVMYTCQANPFPQGLPENVSPTSMVSISIQEVDSNEALSAGMYPFILAEAVMWAVPVLELNIGKVAVQDKKLRG
jgi:hypothetical protein